MSHRENPEIEATGFLYCTVCEWSQPTGQAANELISCPECGSTSMVRRDKIED